MRFTHDHKDRVSYWLTEAAGSLWSQVNRNQKSIIVLLNYQKFYTKIKMLMNNYVQNCFF